MYSLEKLPFQSELQPFECSKAASTEGKRGPHKCKSRHPAENIVYIFHASTVQILYRLPPGLHICLQTTISIKQERKAQ